jgi:methionine synthase reductase
MYYILLYVCRLDLVCPPKKAAVVALADCCVDDADKHQLQWLCSKGSEGKALWSAFIEQQAIGVGELLCLFPSCLPSLATLAAHCPKMAPRMYSIATSQRCHPLSLAVAFSVVRYNATVVINDNTVTSIRRSGLCTTYLEALLAGHLSDSEPEPDTLSQPRIRIFPKTASSFRPPLNPAKPIVSLLYSCCVCRFFVV